LDCDRFGLGGKTLARFVYLGGHLSTQLGDLILCGSAGRRESALTFRLRRVPCSARFLCQLQAHLV
jgi:hypothetical protein